jgi:hypothetical protein
MLRIRFYLVSPQLSSGVARLPLVPEQILFRNRV